MNEKNKSTMSALDDTALESVAGGFGEGGAISCGSFMSNTGTSLNIIVNWYVAADLYGNHEMVVIVSANSGSLSANSFANGVELSVNGMIYTATNNAINYHGGGMVTNTLATFSIPNVYGTVSLTAAWRFNGTYGGVPIGTIYASGLANA